MRRYAPSPLALFSRSYAEMLSPRDQSGLEAKILRVSASNFGLGLGLGLRHLASAWPRSAAEEPAVKKRLTSLFANYRTSHDDTCTRR